MLSNSNDNDTSTRSTGRLGHIRQRVVGWVRENRPIAVVLGLVVVVIIAAAIWPSDTTQPQPELRNANQAVGNGFIDFKQLSDANFNALKGGLEKLVGGVVDNKAEIKKVDAKADTNATEIKKVDTKVGSVEGRVKKIETAPPFPYKEYEEDLKRQIDKLIDERLKKTEQNISMHDAKTQSAMAQVLEKLSVISTAHAEPAPAQHTAAPATTTEPQPMSSDPKVQARVQAFIQHCGENEDMKSVWGWAGTVSEDAFRRHLKSCDDWAASKHAFVARNEQRYGTGSYQEARRYKPAAYAGDRMLDSLGPQGRVLHKIRSPSDLPPNVRRCIVNTVGARGVPGVAVSQKCLHEHWR